MFKNIIVFVLAVFLLQCTTNKKNHKGKSGLSNIFVKSLTYSELKPLLEVKDEKVYVVNFWATWCAPCVKELPYFEELEENYKNQNVEVLLVSLDFPNKKESKLLPFLTEKKIKSKVVLLDDPNEDVWIQAIDSSWSGALPATLIYSKNKRKFFEQSFTRESLNKEIKTFLNL